MSTATPETPTEPAEKAEKDLPRMTFGDHLDELRRRLLISAGAVIAAVLLVVPFKQEVTFLFTEPYERMWFWAYEDFLVELDAREATAVETGEPLHSAWQRYVEWNHEYRGQIFDGTFPPELHEQIEGLSGFPLPRTLKAMGGLEDFWTFMAATLLFALILSAPVVLYQIWSFIGAGLYRHERGAVMRYLPFGLVLLAAGVCFGYFVVVPMGLFFLIKLMYWAKVTSMMSVKLYFSFLLTLTLALGLVFQLPLVMLAIQKIGAVSHETMRKNWRYVVLSFFVISAMITPPDPFTQVMMAGPMILLYVLGLFLTARSARLAAAAEL